MVKGTHKIAAVVNPYSGNGRAARHWPEIARLIEDMVGDFTFLRTERPGHATELVRQALRDGCERIISVGGDGTHHEVINGFFDGFLPINPRAAMAIMPLGTGSDLARTLRMPKGRAAIPHLVGDRVVAADLGRVTFTMPGGAGQSFLYFINTCHVGMGGAVVERVNRTTKKYGGLFSYLWGTLATLATYEPPFLEIEIDGYQLDQVCRDVIVAKGQYDGGGMHVAPNAQIDDGVFDVYVIGNTSRMFCLTHLPAIYKGRLGDYPDQVKYFPASRITIRSDTTVLINLDGEQPGQLPAAIEIMPKALNIVTASPLHDAAEEETRAARKELAQKDLEEAKKQAEEANKPPVDSTAN
jgi:YegS/Rv2252/BmrU family lipid kinase